jgi:hypothetical protein
MPLVRRQNGTPQEITTVTVVSPLQMMEPDEEE